MGINLQEGKRARAVCCGLKSIKDHGRFTCDLCQRCDTCDDLFANYFCWYPSESLNMIGVDRNEWKTTVTHKENYLLEELGKPIKC